MIVITPHSENTWQKYHSLYSNIFGKPRSIEQEDFIDVLKYLRSL